MSILFRFAPKKANGWLEPIGAMPAEAAVDLLNEFGNCAFIPIALMLWKIPFLRTPKRPRYFCGVCDGKTMQRII